MEVPYNTIMDRPELKISEEDRKEKVRDFVKGLFLDDDRVNKIRDTFAAEIEAGLKYGLEKSCLQMENTFVTELTDGSEEGKFLALDLGGTNFRVILLEMSEGKITREDVEYFSVDERTRLGPGIELFDFLASCIKKFVADKGLTDEMDLALGFTFSFPMTQTAIDSGILVTWTKSFTCPGVVGRDAAEMLRESLRRMGVANVAVVAILNDTTGTLIRGAYDDPSTAVGLILATGCNGAYIEKVDGVNVVMDPEWGAFGDNGCIDFIKTDFDRKVDEESLLPGSFTFEKYIAGKYSGDLLRHVLIGLVRKGLLFEDDASAEEILSKQYVLTAVDISTIEGASEGAENVLRKLGIKAKEADVAIVKYVSAILSERFSLLVAIPLTFFIDRMKRDMATIAVTGSLYQHHPKMKGLLEKYIERLKSSPDYKFKFILSDDGSGKGAGLVAAIAKRIHSKKSVVLT